MTWENFPADKIAIGIGNNYLKTPFLANANIPSDVLLFHKIFLCMGRGKRREDTMQASRSTQTFDWQV